MIELLGGTPVKRLLPASNIGANTQPILERLVRDSGFLSNNNTIQANTTLPLTLEESEKKAEKLQKEWSTSEKAILPPNGFNKAEEYRTETTQRKRCAEVRAWILLESKGVSEGD